MKLYKTEKEILLETKEKILNYVINKNNLQGKLGEFNNNKIIIGYDSVKFNFLSVLGLDNTIEYIVEYFINGENRGIFKIIKNKKTKKIIVLDFENS